MKSKGLDPPDIVEQAKQSEKRCPNYLAQGSREGQWIKGSSQYGPQQAKLHEVWCELRNKYRILDLTRGTDRLVAIQGVMMAAGLAENVAGISKNILLPDLL